ncbi:MAG: cache domain-containing protein [Pseudomonadota bacterium]
MPRVRLRLLLLALLPLVVVLPLLLGGAVARWSGKYDELLIAKVASDLRVAEQYLQRIMARASDEVRALAGSAALARAGGEGQALTQLLEARRRAMGLDFLVFQPADQARISRWPVVTSALEDGIATAIEIFDAEALAAVSPTLAERARIPLIPTAAAVPTTRRVETRGMIVHTAARLRTGALDGVLVGGTLLNRNHGFIDTINELVYAHGAGEAEQGTATLFLEDVRITTNVRLFGDVRALGTRVSAEVRGAVLGDGRTWRDRAFVVDDWYVSGYLPLLDSRGARVGMLYVGFLEAPYRAIQNTSFAVIAVAFIAVLALTVPLFLWLARGIFAPLERMTKIMTAVEQGNLRARIGPIGPGEGARDEIAAVAGHLDRLLDQVQERDRHLRAWAEELNTRVDARTEELRTANAKLEATFAKLAMREKLAAIGEITAGVAHEINNPVAVIQGNVDVLRESLEGSEADVATELRLIDQQIQRVNVVVGKLLQFAQPSDYSDFAERVEFAQVLSDCHFLVKTSMVRAGIAVDLAVDDAPPVRINPSELQQVVINLMNNARQAMGRGGRLRLRLSASTRDGVPGALAEVADDGPGIAPEALAQIFDPFFTTKRGEGTGLGLSVSQALIQRAGGIIEVESRLGEGTRFSVWLPAADSLSLAVAEIAE